MERCLSDACAMPLRCRPSAARPHAAALLHFGGTPAAPERSRRKARWGGPGASGSRLQRCSRLPASSACRGASAEEARGVLLGRGQRSIASQHCGRSGGQHCAYGGWAAAAQSESRVKRRWARAPPAARSSLPGASGGSTEQQQRAARSQAEAQGAVALGRASLLRRCRQAHTQARCPPPARPTRDTSTQRTQRPAPSTPAVPRSYACDAPFATAQLPHGTCMAVAPACCCDAWA
jgi:hypothetical protein